MEESGGFFEAGLVVDARMRALCVKPYPGHPKGCPNWNRKFGCPPAAPMIDLLLDLSRTVFVIWNRFDFGSHVDRMRQAHPSWTGRQLACCLYWQPKARKALAERVAEFRESHAGMRIIQCPEASGVNLTATMRQAGIELEWPPERWAYQVVVAGHPLHRIAAARIEFSSVEREYPG